MRIVWTLLFVIGCAKSTPPTPAAAETAAATETTEAIPSADEEAVRAAWESYRQAILAGDGPTLAASVNQGTLDYYETLVSDSLSLGREELLSRDLLDVLTVLQMRLRLTPDKIQALKGSAFQQLSSDPTWVDPSIANVVTTLVRVKVDGDAAAASWMEVPEDLLPLKFQRQDGEWKVDLMGMLELARQQMPGGMDLTAPEGQQFLLTTLNLAASQQGADGVDEAGLQALLEAPAP